MVRERGQTIKLDAIDNISRWVMKNVPAMKTEKFTSSLINHICRVDFQLSGYNFPNTPFKSVMGSWETLSSDLQKNSDFWCRP
jgi:hypothetical protein